MQIRVDLKSRRDTTEVEVLNRVKVAVRHVDDPLISPTTIAMKLAG